MKITHILFSILCLGFSACLITNQDAETLFSSGELPKVLNDRANPVPQEVDREAYEKLKLDVAVIDNGVDYLHEKLRDRIRFDFDEEGKVVGAGYDFFGNDEWAGPALIDPIPFSFGAKITRVGKIDEPLENPLAKLDEYNEQFMGMLTAAISKDEALAATLFNRINTRSFNVLAAVSHVFNSEDVEGTDYMKMHAEVKAKHRLIRAFGFNQKDWDESDQYSEGFLRTVIAQPWRLSSSSPYPTFGNAFYYFEGYDKFVQTLEEVFEAFDKETQFIATMFTRYSDYQYLLSSDKSRGKEALRSSAVSDLYQSWYSYKTDHKYADPFLSFVRGFCSSLNDLDYMKFTGEISDQVKMAEFQALFERSFKDFEAYAKFILNDKRKDLFSARERRQARKSSRKIEEAKPWLMKALTDRGTRLLVCDSRRFQDAEMNPFRDAYREHYRKTDDPFLHSDSASESHGTHVASLITAQTDDVGVVPVRVVTSSFDSLPQQDAARKAEFWSNFVEWLKKDVVYPATVELLQRNLKEAGVELTGEETAEARDAGVSELVKLLEPALAEEFESRKLAFYFVPQLIDAIKYVGKKRILIGSNISLQVGTTLPVTPVNRDDEVEMINNMDFLVFEYFKYYVGEALVQDAPNTLFVIAAGNDGAWMDGDTRSGLPCDVSSPFLLKHAKEGQQPPNNQVENILCVGSINPDGKLSPFSNLPLSPRVKFLVSYGEALRAMIRTTDCTGIYQEVSRQYGDFPFMSTFSINIEEFIDENGGMPEGMSDKEKKRFIKQWRERLALSSNIVGGMFSMARTHECVTASEDKLAKFTGTSMASPVVSGQMAKYALGKMDKLGLGQKDAYGHEEFKPAKLVREVMDISPRCSDLENHPLYQIRAIKDGVMHMGRTCVPEDYLKDQKER